MVKITLYSTKTVAELKQEFNNAFNAKLKIYIKGSQANGDIKLEKVGLSKDGYIECSPNLTVGEFINRMHEFGLKVKVYTSDEWIAVLDNISLTEAGRIKKNCRKAEMNIIIERINELKERLAIIVNNSYFVFCNKIANEEIKIHNEASMQLQLGVIIKQFGTLYTFSPKEHFVIHLESHEEIPSTQKSAKGKARCDIKLELIDEERKISALAFIELKYFKYGKGSETVTDNVYSLYADLENLEQYQKENSNSICYEILYTNNGNYSKSNDNKYKISDSYTIKPGEYENTKNRKVIIKGEYKLHWDKYKEPKHNFLKIDLQ